MTLPPFPAMAEAPAGPTPRKPLELPSIGEAKSGRTAPTRRIGSPPMPIESSGRSSQGKAAMDPTEPLPTEFTDADLAAAIAPLLPSRAEGSLVPDHFEAALRSAMRRTLAQHIGSPFDDPALAQKTLWRFNALFSSRSYDEVVQEKTGRFRIEELYLLESERLTMISFASVDPSRHANPRKVHATVDRIAAKARLEGRPAPTEFSLKKPLRVLIRQVDDLVLAAVVRGQPDPLVDEDLAYALQRIRRTHGPQIAAGLPLLTEIQPLLEECLLIHSPLAPLGR